jgi:predicted nucleic acid-binding protein
MDMLSTEMSVMTMNKCFVDSNIWIYSFTGDNDSRGAIAREFIGNAPASSELFISYQVINETVRVLKKLGYTESELRKIIDSMFLICNVCSFTKNSAILASKLRETMLISYWDSHIAAIAVLAGCDVLVSEDFQDGTSSQGVMVKNIFELT